MELASCFIPHFIDQFVWRKDFRICKNSGINIIGLAKLLAYGDFLEARASQRNETILEVLDEEVNKYPYLRKSEPKVGERKSLYNFFDLKHLSNLAIKAIKFGTMRLMDTSVLDS